MKKVFVTGGTGFVGSYMLRQLLGRGYEIRAVKRKESPLALVNDIKDQIEWVEGDVTDLPFLQEVMTGIHQVYHAAAVVSFNVKDKVKMLKVNGEGTANIVNVSLDLGIEKLLHVSSIAALGRTENQNRINENTLWENSGSNSDYAISKFKAECEVWRGIEEGLSAIIINPSLIMGSGYWHVGTNQMFEQVHKGLYFYPKGGAGYVDVRDVAAAAIELMESQLSGQRFIVNSENLLFKNVFTMIANTLNKKGPFVMAPSWMIEFLWRLDGLRSSVFGVEPKFTKDLARGLDMFFEYDNSKIVKSLNFKFRTLDQTIAEISEQFKESKKNKLPFAIMKNNSKIL